MEPNEIMQAISSMGFPIVACCILFYLYDKTLREVVATLREVVTTLKDVINTLREVSAALKDKKHSEI